MSRRCVPAVNTESENLEYYLKYEFILYYYLDGFLQNVAFSIINDISFIVCAE